jgi:peptide/nickel transport system ATP-binding protein
MLAGTRVSEPVLRMEGIRRTFSVGRRRGGAALTAVADLTLSVAAGEVVALVGESGAGKTTAGRIALGLERPDAGGVWFEGQDLHQLSAAAVRRIRQRMHFVHQDPYQAFHPSMRLEEAVAEPLAIAGRPRRERPELVRMALEEVRLSPADEYVRRFPHELSGGQRQRAAFARALVGQPRLVVADEPVSMLDVSLQAGILDLVEDLRARHGICFLFVTHDLAVARHVADRIVVMYRGRVVETGTADDLIHNPLHPYTVALLRAVEELAPAPPRHETFPPGGQPCQVLGRCDPERLACRDAVPVLVEHTAGHCCATHIPDGG